MLSDFADAGYHDVLRVAARRHDVIGMQVYDERDEHLPNAGMLQVHDAETGKTLWLDTSDTFTRLQYNGQFIK